MTTKELTQLYKLQKEARILRRRISLSGDETVRAELEKQERRVKRFRVKLEKFISTVEDSRLRGAMSLRYGEGFSWIAVARAVDGRADTADSLRVAVSRYVKNNSKK